MEMQEGERINNFIYLFYLHNNQGNLTRILLFQRNRNLTKEKNIKFYGDPIIRLRFKESHTEVPLMAQQRKHTAQRISRRVAVIFVVAATFVVAANTKDLL